MKTIFVCLANSKKYGERCIAGIELKKAENEKLVLVKDGQYPKWIRPVSRKEYGQVSSHLVEHIKLNELVEIDIVESCPDGYQSENVLFDANSINVLGKIHLDCENLDKLSVKGYNLFGNQDNAVSQEKIHKINHSLVLIKAIDPEIYVRDDYDKKQLRMKFYYGNCFYNLPITDLDFQEEFYKNRAILDNVQHIYLTISLGVSFNGYHYKLVAGVIYL